MLGRVQERDRAKARGAFLRELEDRAYERSDVKHAAVVERAGGAAVRAYAELLGGRQVPAEALLEFILAGVSADGLDIDGLDVRVLEATPRTFSGKADRHGLSRLDV
ncbi:MAG: hypothetical protein M3065_03070 [Actinomycetota bacterium]|nr:hypothetical protein [Actinomycetota bacterium]